MNRRTCPVTVLGVTESEMTEPLRVHTHTHTHTHTIPVNTSLLIQYFPCFEILKTIKT